MATDQRNLLACLSTNADFQTWAQGIHAQLIAAGLIQTSDTGQLNLATATIPNGAAAGYEMFRFNDAAQSSNPIFIKIEYGTVQFNATRPGIWITVGPSTNGSGTIGGITSGRQTGGANASYGVGQTLPSFASGDGSWFGVGSNQDVGNNNAGYMFGVDRIRDATGTPTGEGYVMFWTSTSGGPAACSVQNNVFSGVAGSFGSGSNGVFPGPTPMQGSGAIGGGLRVIGQSVGVMPCMTMAAQLRYLKCGVIFNASDMASVPGVTFSAFNFGANHTYLAGLASSWSWSPMNTDRLALLWE